MSREREVVCPALRYVLVLPVRVITKLSLLEVLLQDHLLCMDLLRFFQLRRYTKKSGVTIMMDSMHLER
jgi:hypothetical protein